MIDIEISLVKAFSWSLRDIDETDVESLMPFIHRLGRKKEAPGARKAYVDEVGWL
jgi:hypothetical protein